MNATIPYDECQRFELRFEPLAANAPAYAFPCDQQGRVDMDALGERARDAYLYARTVIGREFLMPRVQPRAA